MFGQGLLGGLFGQYPQQARYPWGIPVEVPCYSQFSQPIAVCVHGADCPLCREQREKLKESIRAENEKKKKEEENYQKRCKAYLKGFRRRYKQWARLKEAR